jgi:hypothetical protein
VCAGGAPPPAFETIPDPINDVADIERLIGALAGAQKRQGSAELVRCIVKRFAHHILLHCSKAATGELIDRGYGRLLGSDAEGARMKKLFAAIVAVSAFVGAPALAADMLLKAPAAAPPPAFSWTGFYLGGFAGGAGTRSVSNPDATNPGTVGPFPPGTPVTGCNFGAGPGLTPAVSRPMA